MTKMPEKDPNNWIALWHSMPDTVRASILGLLLALIMAFKQDGRTLSERVTDVMATPILVVISGYSLQSMGFSESLVFVLAGVFAGYGIGPVKAVLKRWLEKKVDSA
jgi:type III secretory pathway component EscS